MTTTSIEQLYLPTPFVPVEVFGVDAPHLETTIADLLEDIHLSSDSIGNDAIYNATQLVMKSANLHSLMLLHLQSLINAQRDKEYEQKYHQS